MAYVEYTGHCDICGKSNLYVKYYYDHDKDGNIINDRMECIDCSDARKHKWATENYDKGGKQYLEFKEKNKEEDMRIRDNIEKETERILQERKMKYDSVFKKK